MNNIYQTFQESAQNFPDKIAITDTSGSYTYSQLYTRTEELRQKLEEREISYGAAIGIITENNHEFVVCLYAAVATGALVMPIYHQQTDEEIKSSILDAQLHAVIAVDENKANLAGNTSEISSGTSVYYFAETERPVSYQTAKFIKNPAFMRFTSGTTGTAKGVIISHENVLARIEAANEALQLTATDNVLWVFPMAYHFVVSIVLYLKLGATIVVNNSFLAEDILASIRKHKVSFFYCSPMHIKMLAASAKGTPEPTLKQVISTTTGASQQDCIAFENRYKLPVKQAFGIIEVGLPLINSNEAKEHPDAVGHALPAFEVEILDDDFAPVAINTIGLLAVKGKGMFSGYLNPPKLAKKVLKKGWFMTGDLATKSESGLITIKGRKKNVIIVHGNKVFPNEIEEVINRYEGIKLSKVYGQAHPLFGEIVMADLVVTKSIEVEDLLDHCKVSLSAFKIPQKVNFVDAIEMTSSGKIKRA